MGKQVGARFRQIMVSKIFGLVNFVPELHLPFVQIGIYRQTAVKGLKLESNTEHEVPLLQEIFRRNDAKRRVPFTF